MKSLIDKIGYDRLKRAFSQFWKYCLVGITGYLVNLLVYIPLVERVGLHYLIGATVSFCVAATNNFLLNKYWTFGNPQGGVMNQAGKFLVVSVFSLLINLLVLRLLVEDLGIHEVTAQIGAIAFVTGLNFLGNKLWSFRQPTT